tara:strand:- start:95 stop:649 length:555 start_codon:yes stop_codon:yes gene_type:complete
MKRLLVFVFAVALLGSCGEIIEKLERKKVELEILKFQKELKAANENISEIPQQTISEFSDVVPGVDNGRVLLCFFATGCEKCKSTLKSLDSLNSIYENNFPRIEIIFMEEEIERIPEFFEFSGNTYPYQILDIPNFYDVLTWERDIPGVFYINNGNIITSYNGINKHAFNVNNLEEIISKDGSR